MFAIQEAAAALLELHSRAWSVYKLARSYGPESLQPPTSPLPDEPSGSCDVIAYTAPSNPDTTAVYMLGKGYTVYESTSSSLMWIECIQERRGVWSYVPQEGRKRRGKEYLPEKQLVHLLKDVSSDYSVLALDSELTKVQPLMRKR